jgi:hypothetical protein
MDLDLDKLKPHNPVHLSSRKSQLMHGKLPTRLRKTLMILQHGPSLPNLRIGQTPCPRFQQARQPRPLQIPQPQLKTKEGADIEEEEAAVVVMENLEVGDVEVEAVAVEMEKILLVEAVAVVISIKAMVVVVLQRLNRNHPNLHKLNSPSKLSPSKLHNPKPNNPQLNKTPTYHRRLPPITKLTTLNLIVVEAAVKAVDVVVGVVPMPIETPTLILLNGNLPIKHLRTLKTY